MAPPQRVLVSYSGAQVFLSSGSWDQIHTALLAQLPLRNIHWKSPSRPSIRTIQELDISLVPLESLRDEHTSQIPATLLEKPFLNIYIVTCEDTDLETYKTSIKRQVKDWHSIVTSRKNQEWLILHVVRRDARTPSGNFFQLKGSVLDKLKADFNTDRRDRCVQLAWTAGYDNPAAWAEFVNKLKDGLLSSFDLAVSQREDDVKRSESQRQMPGWNFCTFFILKESLAGSFQGVNLFEDALLQYDELEASFYQVLKEKNLSWFGTLITPGPNDDSCPLLSISKKPYRDLILANTISVFDFRIYLLARQCELLANLGRINEVSRKAAAFLGAFGRRLREVEENIPEFFVESWTYSSALSVVDQCDTWSVAQSLQGAKLSTFNAGKGELLELARNQLDIIGVKVGHLPARPPFSNSPNPPSTSGSPESDKKISNPDILESIKSGDTFYDTYVGITNRAIDMYAKAGRRKFALKLHGSLAALDVHRGRLAAALTTYTSLPAHYAPHMWTSLESLMLSLALDTHAALDKSKDREWIHILLSYLKTHVETVGQDLLMHEEDSTEYISRLVSEMKRAASTLESDLSHSDHPAISIQVSPTAKPAGDTDGSFLDVIIHNHLPCIVPIDGIAATLSGRDSERLKFTAHCDAISPGKTEAVLFCPTSSAGTYILDSTEAHMSHLVFQWAHRKILPGGRSPGHKNAFTLVRIPKDLLSMDVRLHQPNLIELGKPPTLLVAVSTGRNRVAKASIKLHAPSVTFRYSQVTLTSAQNDANSEAAEECLSIMDLQEASHLELLLPYSDASAFHAMRVDVEVEYVTVAEPNITRILHLARVVATTLPISVNVEDFFRGNRLFSKFTVSTTSHQHVRIAAAHLQIPAGGLDGVKVVACSPQARSVVTVTPAQPANFLFYLDSVNGPVRDSLKFRISYRMLREEVEALIEASVEQVTSSLTASLAERVGLVNRLVEALEQDSAWVEMYGLSGELNVPEVVGELDQSDEPLSQVIKLLHEHRHPHPSEGKWREIKIPVDVPYMTIVAAARIRLVSSTSTSGISSERTPSLYAGQPIPAILTIHTSFHWGSSVNDKERAYMMRFDVEEMVREWLVSGRKRGDFAAMDDATYSVPITLVALHHGELTLPKVAVTALPLAGEVTMGSMAIPSTETYQVHGAEKILVLPRGGRSTFVLGMGSG
ncbi:trafficking protein particle complex subunit 10 [Mycena belliarum]|uniref:Trafficking protein particle complex subunit 10 n=1 Tax=Mycena belliarum TaxID=1033014 RepID=A0AAD6UGA0_9AGAR|nr:trafficking protein particle complex subunit 10 [Mycena belliae]